MKTRSNKIFLIKRKQKRNGKRKVGDGEGKVGVVKRKV